MVSQIFSVICNGPSHHHKVNLVQSLSHSTQNILTNSEKNVSIEHTITSLKTSILGTQSHWQKRSSHSQSLLWIQSSQATFSWTLKHEKEIFECCHNFLIELHRIAICHWAYSFKIVIKYPAFLSVRSPNIAVWLGHHLPFRQQ